MPKLLILSYHFVPEGGPAVQRIVKFVKYLPPDFQTYVLTVKNKPTLLDNSLLADIPTVTKMYRTWDAGRWLPGAIRRVLPRLFVPDKFALWPWTAVRKGIDLVRREKIDLVLATAPPYSVALAARSIAAATALPLVVDFRDEWTGYPLFHEKPYPDEHRRLENQVLARCSYLTTVSDKSRGNFSNRFDPAKIRVIRNGFDRQDFTHFESSDAPRPLKFCIGYAGRLNALHSPTSLFKALRELKQQGNLPDHIRLMFIGGTSNERYLHHFPELHGIVDFQPYQPHTECLQRLAGTDALLLLATQAHNTEIITGKVFEYFYLKKPILAVLSTAGELKHLLEAYGPACIGYENDIPSIQNAFLKLIAASHTQNYPKIADTFVQQFDRQTQAHELAEVLRLALAEFSAAKYADQPA